MESLKIYCENHKKQILFGCSLLLLTIITLLSFVQIEKKYSLENKEIVATLVEKNTDDTKEPEEVLIEIEEDTPKMIRVDVKGFVINEGVYSLESGSRVIDAIEAAGGLSDGAYTRYLNLSKIIYDEDVIIINDFYEVEQMKLELQEKTEEKIPCEITSQACLTEEKIITSSLESSKNDTKTNAAQSETSNTLKDDTIELNTLVNINTASKEKLMTLNGVGESTSEKIIEYRNTHGFFQTIEEIKNVSGIGDSIYEKIKENITVE